MNIKPILFSKRKEISWLSLGLVFALPFLVSCSSSKTPSESKSLMDFLASEAPETEIDEDVIVYPHAPISRSERVKEFEDDDEEEEMAFAVVNAEGEFLEISGTPESAVEYTNDIGETKVEIIVRNPDGELMKIKGKQISTIEDDEEESTSLAESSYTSQEYEELVEDDKPIPLTTSAEKALIDTYQAPSNQKYNALSQQHAALSTQPDANLVPQYVAPDPEINSILNEQFNEEVISNSNNVNDIKISMTSRHAPAFLRRANASAWEHQYDSIGQNLFKGLGDEIIIKKPVNMCTRRDVLYVKMHNHSSLSSDYFEDAVMSTLQRNEFFDKTVTRQPTVFINVEPPEMGKLLPDGRIWYDKDDPLTIGQIKKLYPEDNLMILEVRLQEFSKSEPIAITANLIDASDGTTVLIWRSPRSVWYRAEDMQAAKVMEEINDWLEDIAEICDCNCEVKA